MTFDCGNPWRFHRSTEWKKAMDGFFCGQLRTAKVSSRAHEKFADPSAYVS